MRPLSAASAGSYEAASNSSSFPLWSAAMSSWKPPISSPSTRIWGKVIIPVFSFSATRPSASMLRLISSKGISRALSSAFACEQKGQGVDEYITTFDIATNVALSRGTT